jgi:polysaccharide deacetylase family protein (PEP-CTERM system associated)
LINVLSIDVEDYCAILQRDWLNIPDAKPTESVVRNTHWYLQTFKDHKVKATFFILGEIAESFPKLIKDISDEGHEIAVHGFYHRQIFKLSGDEFKTEVGNAKKLLEDLSGQQVIGHRAPAFSINKDTQWALEVLVELGFKYDSSIYPMQGKRYGWSDFKKEIHTMKLPNGLSIIEVPMSTISFGIKELGIGGGYFRHFPYLYTKWAISHIQKKRPVIVYMHPYEIDTDRPSIDFANIDEHRMSSVLKFHRSQMRNRHTVKRKVNKLFTDFKFSSIADILKSR